MNTEKISKRQFICLVILFTIGSSILIIPAGITAEAKQDAWVASIIGLVAGLLLVWLYTTLGNKYTSMSLIQYTEKILGKWLGKFVSFLFFTFSFLLSALVLRNIGDFMATQVLPDTPIVFIYILFLITVMFGVKYGIETFARASEILLPWALLLLGILIIFTTPQIDFKKIQPILKEGIKPIIKGSIPFIGTPFLELVVFLMLFPNIDRKKGKGKAFLIGTLIGGAILIVIISYNLLVLGADLTIRHSFPTYILGKKIKIGNFIDRVEGIIAGIWIVTIFFKLTILYYVSVLSLAQLLNLKSYKFLFFPLAMIMIVLSLVAYPNTTYFQSFVGKIWPPYALTYGFVYPFLLLIIRRLKK